MKHLLTTKSLALTDPDVTVQVVGRKVIVAGPKGTIEKDFSHCPCKLKVVKTSAGQKLMVRQMNVTTKQGATVRSIITTVDKMMTGVKIGYRYKMRLVYAHFPINIKIADDGTFIEIRNYIGERRVRKPMMMGETRVKLGEMRDEIYIEGIDLKDVSQSAARIHLSCRARNKDIRKFLDGIYVHAKGPMGDEKAV